MGTWAPSHLGHPHPCPLMPVLQRALLGPTTHPSWPRHPWSVLVRCEDQGGHVQALHLAPGQNFSEGLAYCPGDRGMSSSFHCGFVLGEAVQSMDGAWAWNQPLSVPKKLHHHSCEASGTPFQFPHWWIRIVTVPLSWSKV